MNAMMIICPYRWNGMWVFDDEATTPIASSCRRGLGTRLGASGATISGPM